MYKIILSLVTLSLFCTSCCSLAIKKTEPVLVTAQQGNADVYIDGYACGTTPIIAELDKKYDHLIVVSKPGYQPQKACVKSSHSWKSGLNVVSPIIGAGIGTGIGLACFGPCIFPIYLF